MIVDCYDGQAILTLQSHQLLLGLLIVIIAGSGSTSSRLEELFCRCQRIIQIWTESSGMTGFVTDLAGIRAFHYQNGGF